MNRNTVLKMLVLLVAFFTVAGSSSITAGEIDNLIADIDKLVVKKSAVRAESASGDPDVDRMISDANPSQEIKDLEESIRDRVDGNPHAVSAALIPRLHDACADSEKLATYILILGTIKDTSAIDPIIDIAQTCDSGDGFVMVNCLRALTTIGGEKSGEFLLLTLSQLSDPEKRYDIIDFLSEMQYEKAIPLTMEILEKPSDPYWWQPLFIFGKMGDKGVPFLLGKIEDTNRVVRANAVGMLASWLAEPKADSVLREHYWREADPEIRQNIVMSIDAFCPDLDTAVSFLKQAAVKDTLTAIAEEIRTSLEVLAGARQQLDSLKRAKKPSSKDFQKQYDKIYESAGSEGDYDVLLISSTIADEPRLKTLREHVLQRNSDECFYDYHKINKIIVRNRLLYR